MITCNDCTGGDRKLGKKAERKKNPHGQEKEGTVEWSDRNSSSS